MMGKLSKDIVTAAAVVLAALPLAACGKKTDGGQKNKSGLYGTFTYQETLGADAASLRVTNDPNKEAGRSWLYSTVFPIASGNEGMVISYNMDQRLKLNRDGTYRYDYSILLSNPRDWGGQIARLTVGITGEFDYVESSEGKYGVLLGDPTGGTQTVYAAHLSGADSYGWSIHSRPDLVIDYEIMSSYEDYVCDKYVRSRVVAVDKSDKSLRDDIFFADLLDYITAYCTY